jgi:hypothetical protein
VGDLELHRDPALDLVVSFRAMWNCPVGTVPRLVPRFRHPIGLRTNSRKPVKRKT